MSGLFITVWCRAVCFLIVLLPVGESTGVFEVQLTSLINGWGLTYNGLCCSRHNHIQNIIDSHSPTHSDQHQNGISNKLESPDVEVDIPEEEEEEEDWLCEEECQTFLHVCLSHMQDPLPTESEWTVCTFGSAMSPVLGGNTLDPFGTWEERQVVGDRVDPDTVVRIPFTFSWPEEYTLVVEAWHDEHGNRTIADRHHLIARAVEGGSLQPSLLWQNHTTASTNTDLSFRFRVLCDSHYYGAGCDVLCRASDDPIIGHYACDEDGSRVCLPGWEGESCDRAQCSEECTSGHGFCEEPNQCRCRLGWRGVHCSQCQTFPNCLHGYCNEAWQCLCQSGWSGSLCNIDNFYCERYRPCQNGGTCEYDPLTNYTCTCPRGYGGHNCQLSICYPGLCLNKGVCVMIDGVPFCRCRRGFEGERCEHVQVTCGSVTCRNNGTCTRQGLHFQCLCRPGFTGRLCETEIDECQSSPCKHGGVCRDRLNGYHCECTAGHAGRNCDLLLDPCMGFKCFNHGTCVTLGAGFTPSCMCRPEFTGQRCETPLDPCVGIACLNGGTCLRTGSASFHCACANGYSGSVCQIPPPSLVCQDQPCLNGGTCRRTQNGVMMCACPAGFGGALCEEREGSTVVVDLVTTDSVVGEYEETTERGGGVEEEPGGKSPRNLQVANSSVHIVACRTVLLVTFTSIMIQSYLTLCFSNPLLTLS